MPSHTLTHTHSHTTNMVMTMKLPENLTEDQILDAVERQMLGTDNPGFCLACGEEAFDCEPDARGYECDACGERKVYGAAEILMMIA